MEERVPEVNDHVANVGLEADAYASQPENTAQSFLYVPLVIQDDMRLSSDDIMVYMALRRAANWATGRSRVSQGALCHRSRVSRRLVNLSLHRLTQAGYIRMSQAKQGESNYYYLTNLVGAVTPPNPEVVELRSKPKEKRGGLLRRQNNPVTAPEQPPVTAPEHLYHPTRYHPGNTQPGDYPAGPVGASQTLPTDPAPAPPASCRKPKPTPLIAPPDSPRVPDKQSVSRSKPSWLTPFHETWEATFGGPLPAGPSVRPLRKAIELVGKAEALARWRRYLADAGKYANAAGFLSKIGMYSEEPAQTPPTTNPLDDPMIREIMEQQRRSGDWRPA